MKDYYTNCPMQDCAWYGVFLTQQKATDALVSHCVEKHDLPEQITRRFWKYWLGYKRAFRGWTTTLDEIDKLTGFPQRASGFINPSKQEMEAYLGIGTSSFPRHKGVAEPTKKGG